MLPIATGGTSIGTIMIVRIRPFPRVMLPDEEREAEADDHLGRDCDYDEDQHVDGRRAEREAEGAATSTALRC